MSLSSSVMAGAPSYYHEAGPPSPTKYHENGHDTFSDFVTLVCQEAQNTQHTQVICLTLPGLPCAYLGEREVLVDGYL